MSRGLTLLGLTTLLLLVGCQAGPRPLNRINQPLSRLGSSESPSLAGGWLALIASRQAGRPQVQLIDVRRNAPVPLPGLNRADSLPLSVAVDQNGERLALVRQRDDRSELLLYRRSLQATQTLAIEPAGVPRRVSLSADGRVLAVEVSRNGLWQVDLLELP
jgi:dipeptidyl aminopeptidase/acylaminoacyl peptidase